MKAFGVLAVAAAAKLVSAHATIQYAWVNGVDQGLGNSAAGYIRSPPSNSPLLDVTSKDMTCNVNNVATAKTLSLKAGDKFEFEWHHEDRRPGDEIIAASHNGPVMVYIAPTDKGSAGTGWVKLSEDGYDGKWGVQRLIANGGKHGIVIPDIAAGDYLLRAEIIALHEAFMGKAQFYMECVQVKITSSGTKTLPAGVPMPGTYSPEDPGIHFDLYNGFKSYKIPGPPVWDGASSGPAPSDPSPTSPPSSPPSPPPNHPVPTTFQTWVRPSSTPVAPPPADNTPPTDNTPPPSTPPPADNTPPTDTTPPPSTPPPAQCGGGNGGGGASGKVAIYQRCGGTGHTGGTECDSGLICKQWNPYYFQCISP